VRRPPQRIGTVEIDDTLGSGGMGVVYVGSQPGLGRSVVVKGLRGQAREDNHAVARFQREAQAMATVQHQNVVAVFDAFEWRGEPWIVQEYVDGADLARLLAHQSPLEPRLAALIGLSIVRGLEEIHDRGIVHRDLKPSNVLLGRNGDVKICDFGIALDHHGPGLTRTGFALGTVPYMAPEQMLGENVDFRSDLFAVGILLYEMLCGDVPFPAKDPKDDASLVRRIQSQKYVRPRDRRRAIPRTLARILQECLRAKPRRRPSSTTDLRRALEKHLGHPSPTDVRSEIAGHLAVIAGDPDTTNDDHPDDASEVDPDATTRTAPEIVPERRVIARGLWIGAASAAVLVLLAAATVGLWARSVGPLETMRMTAALLR